MKANQELDYHQQNIKIMSFSQNATKGTYNALPQQSKPQIIQIPFSQNGLNYQIQKQHLQQQKNEIDDKNISYIFQDASNLAHTQVFQVPNQKNLPLSQNGGIHNKWSPKKGVKMIMEDENKQQFLQPASKIANLNKEVQKNTIKENSSQIYKLNQNGMNFFKGNYYQNYQNIGNVVSNGFVQNNVEIDKQNQLYNNSNFISLTQQQRSPNQQLSNNVPIKRKESAHCMVSPSSLNQTISFPNHKPSLSYTGNPISQINSPSTPQASNLLYQPQTQIPFVPSQFNMNQQQQQQQQLQQYNLCNGQQNQSNRNIQIQSKSICNMQQVGLKQEQLNNNQGVVMERPRSLTPNHRNTTSKENFNQITQTNNISFKQSQDQQNIVLKNQQIQNASANQNISMIEKEYISPKEQNILKNFQKNVNNFMKFNEHKEEDANTIKINGLINQQPINQLSISPIKNNNDSENFQKFYSAQKNSKNSESFSGMMSPNQSHISYFLMPVQQQTQQHQIQPSKIISSQIEQPFEQYGINLKKHSTHEISKSKGQINILKSQLSTPQKIMPNYPFNNNSTSQQLIIQKQNYIHKDSSQQQIQMNVLPNNTSLKNFCQSASNIKGQIQFQENILGEQKMIMSVENSHSAKKIINIDNYKKKNSADYSNNNAFFSNSIINGNQQNQVINNSNNNLISSIGHNNKSNKDGVNQQNNTPYMSITTPKSCNSTSVHQSSKSASNISSAISSFSLMTFNTNTINTTINKQPQQYQQNMNFQNAIQNNQNQFVNQSPINHPQSPLIYQKKLSIEKSQPITTPFTPKSKQHNNQIGQFTVDAVYQNNQNCSQNQIQNNFQNILSSEPDVQLTQLQQSINISQIPKNIELFNVDCINNLEKSLFQKPELEIYKTESSEKISLTQFQNENTQKTEEVEIQKKRKYKVKDFDFVKQLGQGVFGSVYMVRDKKTKGIYAMKVIDKKMIQEKEMEPQLQRELQIHSSYQCLGYFEDETYYYILMEYASDGTCATLIEKQPQKKLNEAQSVQVISQLLEAINYLHFNQIIHRDLKLENILLSNGIIKLCDFGCATYCDSQPYQRRRSFCGTVDYVSPEMVQDQVYDREIDIWALGVIAYELNSGLAPFTQLNEQQTYQSILSVNIIYPQYFSESFKDFLNKIFVVDPRQRATAKQLLSHQWIQQMNEGNQMSI